MEIDKKESLLIRIQNKNNSSVDPVLSINVYDSKHTLKRQYCTTNIDEVLINGERLDGPIIHLLKSFDFLLLLENYKNHSMGNLYLVKDQKYYSLFEEKITADNLAQLCSDMKKELKLIQYTFESQTNGEYSFYEYLKDTKKGIEKGKTLIKRVPFTYRY